MKKLYSAKRAFYGSKAEEQADFIKIVNRVMCIIEFNIDGTIITANDNFLTMMGYTLEEIAGKHHRIFLNEDYAKSEEYANFWVRLKQGKFESGEYQRVAKDGQEIWLYGHYNPILDASGNTYRVVKFADNITKMKHVMKDLNEREGRLSAILNTTVDGMITINYYGIIQSFNPACENIFGYDACEVIGKNVNVLMPEPYHSEHDSYISNYHQTGVAEVIGAGRQVEGKRKDGSIFPLELAVAEVNAGDHILYSGIVRDITKRIKSENIKKEFISVVSHELRTPLTSIRGSLGLIVTSMAKELPDKVNKLINLAYKNCERLIVLINDILDIDKIAAGKMRFDIQRKSLVNLLEQSIAINQAYADKFHVRMELDSKIPDIKIDVDVERFYQICSNLLSNAIKFSDPDAIVKIYTHINNNKIRINVQDFGSGIPESFKNNIFEKFSQADSSDTRAKGGTGLGLHITREIVKHMNGDIGFDTVINKGTTFWVEFPITETNVLAPVNILNQNNSKTNILHIEDDRDLSRLISASLDEKVNVINVTSMREAQEWLKNEEFSLVILDIGLPDGNGISLLDNMYDKTGKMIPVIILSAIEVQPDIYQSVIAAMVKSKISENKITEVIMSFINDNNKDKYHEQRN